MDLAPVSGGGRAQEGRAPDACHLIMTGAQLNILHLKASRDGLREKNSDQAQALNNLLISFYLSRDRSKRRPARKGLAVKRSASLNSCKVNI